jgi:hypothetical protein
MHACLDLWAAERAQSRRETTSVCLCPHRRTAAIQPSRQHASWLCACKAHQLALSGNISVYGNLRSEMPCTCMAMLPAMTGQVRTCLKDTTWQGSLAWRKSLVDFTHYSTTYAVQEKVWHWQRLPSLKKCLAISYNHLHRSHRHWRFPPLASRTGYISPTCHSCATRPIQLGHAPHDPPPRHQRPIYNFNLKRREDKYLVRS